MANNSSRIEEIRHEERQVSAKLNSLTAELNRIRREAETYRQKLSSLEAERLLLERKQIKVTICPDPAKARKKRQEVATSEMIKTALIGLTPAERQELFNSLLA